MKHDSTYLFTTNRNALCLHCSNAWSCIDFSFCVNCDFFFVCLWKLNSLILSLTLKIMCVYWSQQAHFWQLNVIIFFPEVTPRFHIEEMSTSQNNNESQLFSSALKSLKRVKELSMLSSGIFTSTHKIIFGQKMYVRIVKSNKVK